MKYFKKLKIRRVSGDSMSPLVLDDSIAFFQERSSYCIHDVVVLKIQNKEYIKRIADIKDDNNYYFLSEDFLGLDSRVWGFQNKEVIKAKMLFTLDIGLYKKSLKKIFKSK